MEQHLFILLFVTGVALSIPRKYYLIQQEQSWMDAQTYCRTKHTDLATIESDEDMIKIKNEGQKYGLNLAVWIGIYNNLTVWHWSLGNELLGSWTAWDTANGEPTLGINEEFAAIGPSGWFDDVAATLKPCMCYDATQADSNRYVIYSSPLTWRGCSNYCKLRYTDLASVRDPNEHAAILGMIQSSTWIGLKRGIWAWSDETNFFTSSWMQLPNTTYECCGYLNISVASPSICSVIRPFFCYGIIRAQQQIIRMKVQSDQDLNDPTMKAAILAQIKKKLMDRGVVENITVKWREQPDGKVFHIVREKNNTVEDKKCNTAFTYG